MKGLATFLRSLRGGRLVVALIVAAALVATLGRALAAAYVEILWQAQAGYLAVFWKRVLWQWTARVGAVLIVAALVYLNLRMVSATLGGIHIKRRFGNLEISEQLPRSYVLWAIVAAAALLGLWFGAAVSGELGLRTLTLFHAPRWGLEDPVLGHDVGFYVFWMPVLASVLTFALIVTFLLFTLAAAGYAATGALRWARGRIDAQDLTRLHLGGLAALLLVLIGLRLWLSRYLLLLDGTSEVQSIFGYADAQARLPALQTLTVICGVGAGAILWGSWKNRPAPVISAVTAVVIGTLLIGQLYPSLVQDFRVEPNELGYETPYIEHALEFTRLGYGLDELRRERFAIRADEVVEWEAAAEQLDGIPVWSRNVLLTRFREDEARFPYYDFVDVTVDRYPTASGERLVALSVREIDPAGIQDPNWQNLHLRPEYVRGYGAVVSLAADRTPEARPPMVLNGLPPVLEEHAEGLEQLALTRPQVFFGMRPQGYAVVTPTADQFLAPDGSRGVAGVDFPEGIRLASGFRTLVLAWRFRDANLLFASDLTADSRFLIRRRVLEHVQSIAPVLRFEEPYPVVHEGRIVWIVDGFTSTRWFPLSDPQDFGFGREISYVRNSVKATVDAVTGETAFYRVPISDPVADAYAAAFPALLRSIDEMPPALREHVRYPRALLAIQAQVLLQYHQETAPAFHGQEDAWAHPQELAEGASPVAYQPEYGIYSLPGEEKERFHLTTAFVPAGRQNLTALLAGRTDAAGRPEAVLFEVPVQDQVQGPRQIEALVEQDPEISQQFSLWRTGDSEVWTGHLHLLPVGHRLLYVEPIFLAAQADSRPELQRFVVSDGRRVAMAEDLATAVARLSEATGPERGGAVREGEAGPLDPADPGTWPAEALRLLERADARLREGDWAGYGEALRQLRELLTRLAAGDGAGAP